MKSKHLIYISIVTLAAIATGSFLYLQEDSSVTMSDYKETEVHVHSDFLVVVNDEVVDLTDDRYQSDSVATLKHPQFHLHDNTDEVMHRHADRLTLQTLFTSLGFGLADDCIQLDTGEVLCSDEQKLLVVYVNGTPIEHPSSYVNQEEDQILVYYGALDNPKLPDYLAMVTDESCIYSGTCPERGIAPPESCGLTCELVP